MALSNVQTCPHTHVDTWTRGHVDTWTRGHVDTWREYHQLAGHIIVRQHYGTPL